jgi:hypothetical protein
MIEKNYDEIFVLIIGYGRDWNPKTRWIVLTNKGRVV